MTPLRPAVFLDLNGTLILPVQAHSCAEYTLIEGCIEAVQLLNAAGYVCPVVTVQSRIAKGLYSEDEFRRWFRGFQATLRQGGAHIVGPYLCPHQSRDGCACAKPQPLLYEIAARELDVDVARSWVVGDTPGDMEAAASLGSRGCLVRTGWGPTEPGAPDEKHAAFTGRNVLDVARWITARGAR